jgi:hypothetical protein
MVFQLLIFFLEQLASAFAALGLAIIVPLSTAAGQPAYYCPVLLQGLYLLTIFAILTTHF